MKIFGYTIIESEKLDNLILDNKKIKFENDKIESEFSSLKLQIKTLEVLLDVAEQSVRMLK